ncbi:hypothetical protein MTR67_023587 [Solanum verrucosum]|uniref:RNase H type-1 domain-containing protein n=1 Tax=Solanum verrucosum TaxID=315347 RepID=A0AAF0TRI7_SOLVR|nr:hypothetical protein MTR67_023587 [Solanum verrucosum]
MFTGHNRRIDERILQYLPTLVTPEQNQKLQEMPTLEELKQVVFAMNPNSAPGPDGIGGKFYKACWNIIKEDLLVAVQHFFCGHIMPNSRRVKYMILKDILHLLNTVFPYICWPAQWTEVVDLIASCKHDVKVTSVIWKTPPPNSYKLNTDGSALQNPGKIGGGGILRDEQGKIIYAFALPLGEGTNNQAETQAASYGLNWCIQHGYKKIILEVDSELLTRWILQTSTPPWRIQKFVQELQNLVSQCEVFQCNHIYREANSTADFLSKQSHKKDITQHYYIYNQLPHAARGSYILEKMGVQSFRRKKLKRIKKPP